jgi:hypothetical protein
MFYDRCAKGPIDCKRIQPDQPSADHDIRLLNERKLQYQLRLEYHIYLSVQTGTDEDEIQFL